MNRLSQKAVAAAAATGLLPHELLLATARGEATPGVEKPTRDEILDARKAAAPYYAPRLMAVAAKVNDPTNPWAEIFRMIDGSGRDVPNPAAGDGRGG